MELAIQRISTPRVTWLMCTNKNDTLLKRAIESCLMQTMTDFELLLVVNGPDLDHIVAALSKAYETDDRVRVIGTPVHLLNFSLSLGLHLARAPFVARMDADDVSDPNRLATQVDYMQANDDVAVLGSSYLLIDAQNQIHGKINMPETDQEIRRALRFGNPICHPSVMLRRDAILAEGGYLGGRNAEDYDLWLRLAPGRKWRFANLPTPLLFYNASPDGPARRSRMAYANLAGAQLSQFLTTRDVTWLLGSVVNVGKSFFLAKRA
jgi:glycosyltransferase involved in cell wall biosynthesis